MREINVKDAKKWSDEEAEQNLAYLRQRARDAEVAQILEARGEDPDVPAEPTQEPVDPNDPSVLDGMSAQDVADWVGEDQGRAQVAYDREQAQDSPRKGLSEHLLKIVNGEDS